MEAALIDYADGVEWGHQPNGWKIPRRHRLARAFREDMDPETFASYFKFSFVRNPWDRAVSLYHYFLRYDPGNPLHPGPMSFPEWLKAYFASAEPPVPPKKTALFRPQFEWISDERGESLVDYVGRFERIAEDFATVQRRIGVEPKELPHLTSSGRGDYRSYYDDRSAGIVERFFGGDIERWGYTF